MGNVEIPNWLKGLPLAPEFRPTDTEFADPIAYISKIEKEASAFGICKIVPPLPKPSKRYVFSNLNKSLLKCPELGPDVNSSGVCSSFKMGSRDSGNNSELRAVFTTRQQELGQSMKRAKGTVQNPLSGVHKQVWQSGEIYTLEQFESKSKAFARSILGMVKEVSPLVIEAMFWKAASEKPVYVEYANDVPGSAFGESKGQFRYIHRRRRKKAYYKRSLDSSSCSRSKTDSIRDAQIDEIKDACGHSHAGTCLQTSRSTTSIPTFSSNEGSHSTGQKSTEASEEMEGTAGWKLSNSPWNLQVIARSPGSLTRFMPDDIPGVTSPMVYIGMLFSWFAWHVEDHELHSMNFLHTGSPKTWYAVPGDCAFAFEEVIRTMAYGGNIDHLAALTLLGEKTTLLSPEVIVASGIPCCRLIQNPGEFIVTFPRAYHVGFSHGFNCGEAANFGTPQWLTVAKEAAVRRAAMNYLPMLSHQQLLYLLTMSFLSRVPRTLLPGVRSSRLRDRQREERELLVKRAFIKDILQGNNLLSKLLGNKSTSHAVLWNADLLPGSSKDSQLHDLASTCGASMADMSNMSSADKSCHHNLFDEMSLYMENLTDLYLTGDDLPCNFQTDSGALTCVGCGILGFPFMTVVQPSVRSSTELVPVNHHLVQDSPLGPNASMQDCVYGDLPSASGLLSAKEPVKPSLMNSDRGWNTSSKFLRPRIFCLEHAVQIAKMLQHKGGANMLVICHSDYQKIEAHARAVAEEIGCAFDYNDVPLDIASPEDLTLIDLAIDGEEHVECEEDWTSRLGINLRYFVNARKNSPSKQVPYTLALGMLFSDKGPGSEFLSINWQSRRSRSKNLNHLARTKTCDGIQRKKDDLLEGKIDSSVAKKEKLIQYSRRKFKSKQGCLPGVSMVHESHENSKNVSDTLCRHHNNLAFNYELGAENSKSDCAVSCPSVFVSTEMPQMQHEIQVTDVATSISLNTASSQLSNFFIDSTLIDGNVGSETVNQTTDEVKVDGKSRLTMPDRSKTHYKISASDMHGKENQISHDKNNSSSFSIATDKETEMRKDKITETVSLKNKCYSLDLVGEVHHALQSSHKSSKEEAASSTVSLVSQPTVSFIEESSESQGKNYGAESISNDMPLKETTRPRIKTLNGSSKESYPGYDTPINEHTVNGKSFDVPRELCAAVDTHNAVALDDEVGQETQIAQGDNGEINLSTHLLVKQQCEFAIGKYIEGSSDSLKQHLIQNENDMYEESAPLIVAKWETKGVTVSCSEVSMETCPEGDSRTQFISDRNKSFELQSESINDEEPRFGTETLLKDSSFSIQECFTIEKEACAGENLKGSKGDLSLDNTEPKSSELTTPVPSSNPKKRKKEVEQITELTTPVPSSNPKKRRKEVQQITELTTPVPGSNPRKKRKSEVEQITEKNISCDSFIRSPCEGLRPRAGKVTTGGSRIDVSNTVKENLGVKRAGRYSDVSVCRKNKKDDVKKSHRCDIDGCHMSFITKAELLLHKRNQCPHEGCGKKFRSHKYAVLHQRVHDDERPLKCPWKGCSMSFKWAWARTEHIRVHTGEKPYKCKVEGCGLSFRFVSDFSRHRRKTGHYVESPA